MHVGVFLNHSALYFMRQDRSLNLVLADSAGLAGQQALEILRCVPPPPPPSALITDAHCYAWPFMRALNTFQTEPSS